MRIRRLYRQGGVKALRPIKPPGRPSRATPVFIEQMKQTVQTHPLTRGYGGGDYKNGKIIYTVAHLKRTVLANVLFAGIEDLVDVFRRGLAGVNGRRNKIGFMFNHDDVCIKAA